MITKGFITALPQKGSNLYKVRIPIFDQAGINSNKVTTNEFTATLSHDPGNLNAYALGDCVYLGFEDNDYSKVIILGILDTADEREATTYALLNSLKVTNSVTLPDTTIVGDVSFKDIINDISQIQTKEDKLPTYITGKYLHVSESGYLEWSNAGGEGTGKVDSVSVNGGTPFQPDSHKNVNLVINTSDLTNDGEDGSSPFATQEWVETHGGKIQSVTVNDITYAPESGSTNVNLGYYVTESGMESYVESYHDNTKVDKEPGKGLSTNDFTNAYKNKLNGIESGAEVNVQSDWNVTDSSSDAFIKNKPAINDATLTIQKNSQTLESGTFTANSAVDKTVNITFATNELLVAESGSEYIDLIGTYTRTSQLINDGESGTSPYATQEWVETHGGSIQSITINDTTYRPQFGSTNVDLGDDYVTESGMEDYVENYHDNTKVDKVAGKGLSTEDYTTADKNKLAGIESGAEVNVQANWTESDSSSDAYIQNKPNLATVATTGSYNDLINKPTIPTVNDGTLNIKKNGSSIATFTANQSGNTDANIIFETRELIVSESGSEYIDLIGQGNTNWGDIQGTVTDQTDLIQYINQNAGKVDSIQIGESGSTYYPSALSKTIVIPEYPEDTSSRVSTLESYVSSGTTDSNQLVNEDMMTSAIAASAANLVTSDAQGNSFATHAALVNASTYYSAGQVYTPAKNDYAIVSADETHSGNQARYKCTNATGPVWSFEYVIGSTQVNADWTAVSGVAEILNKPTVGNATITIHQDGVATDQTFDLDDTTNKTINLINTNTTYSLSAGDTANIVKLTPSSGSAQTVTVNNVAHATSADSATSASSATTASKLNNQEPSYYLNYNNFTNTPTIGNATLTITKNSDTQHPLGTFTANATSNSTADITFETNELIVSESGSQYIDLVGHHEATWGSIQGTITNQTDLINYIDTHGGSIKSITINDQTYSPESGSTDVDLGDYVDESGMISYVQSYHDSTKVDKVSGKGLSTNDYTTADKNKLSGIESGAEVNVNADWNAESGTDAFIKNKPTIPAAQVNSDWNASSGVAQILNKPTIPTVNNGTLTIQSNGTSSGTFTANQSSNTTINLKTAEVIDVTNGITQAIKDKVTANPAIILKYAEYYYMPQYTGDDGITAPPTYYNCFEGDSSIFHYLSINWTNLTVSYDELDYTLPDVYNGQLTIQKNGTTVNTFTANSNTNVTANITVPVKLDDMIVQESGSEFIDLVGGSGGGGSGSVTAVTAGAGLNTTSDNTSTDGGTITTTGTLYLTKTAVTPGTYQGITVDKYGRVTGASNQGYTSNTGTVTSVSAGTGLSISGTASVNPTVNIASSYKLPTTTEWSNKQDTLVSGTNIKTINNTSLLGSGNISISGGASLTSITYSDLKYLKDHGQLTPGAYYRITDYTATVNSSMSSWARSAGHVFDIIVKADSTSTLNENATAVYPDADYYWDNYDVWPEGWQIKYSIYNNTDRFDWADQTNGKGVIYYMKDEWGNECFYDFKNIQFKRLLDVYSDGYSNPWIYTFAAYDVSEDAFYDASLTNGWTGGQGSYYLFKNVCKNNILRYGYTENETDGYVPLKLSRIYFYQQFDSSGSSDYGGYNCQNNTFNFIQNSQFYDYCNNNVFTYSSDVVVRGSCNDNRFGKVTFTALDCYNNDILIIAGGKFSDFRNNNFTYLGVSYIADVSFTYNSGGYLSLGRDNNFTEPSVIQNCTFSASNSIYFDAYGVRFCEFSTSNYSLNIRAAYKLAGQYLKYYIFHVPADSTSAYITNLAVNNTTYQEIT